MIKASNIFSGMTPFQTKGLAKADDCCNNRPGSSTLTLDAVGKLSTMIDESSKEVSTTMESL